MVPSLDRRIRHPDIAIVERLLRLVAPALRAEDLAAQQGRAERVEIVVEGGEGAVVLPLGVVGRGERGRAERIVGWQCREIPPPPPLAGAEPGGHSLG